MQFSREQISKIPKSDLHLHLDGSLRLATLIELAREQKVSLPSYTEEGLRELVFKESYTSLTEYLKGFAHTGAVMRDPQSVERIAYELALDCINEGVLYIEVRLAPQLHIQRGSEMRWVLQAVDKGLGKASREYARSAGNAKPGHPPFEYGIVCCAMRTFSAEMGQYYRRLSESFPSTPARGLVGYASYELACAITNLRDELGIPIVGFDIAGAEAGHPAKYHREAYLHCRRHFVGVTVHAGEAYGPESIYGAITECGATRIGHGTNLFDCRSILDPEIRNRSRFCEHLAEYIARTRTTLEVCPTSNLQTNPEIKRLEDHPLGRMLENNLAIALCTDNRLVSHTSVTDEYLKTIRAFGIDRACLRRLVQTGFEGAFFPKKFTEKCAYVEKAMRAFDSVIPENKQTQKIIE